MLKNKQLMGYRWAGKNEPRTCMRCGHLRFIAIHNCGTGEEIKKDWRCCVIGLNESIRYAVRDGYTCRRFAYFPEKSV